MPFRWTVRESHLSAYGGEVARAARDVVGKAVLDIHAEATTNTAVRTGRLKTSWQPILPDAGSKDIQGGVGSNVEYAAYYELGTGQRGAASSYPFPRSARYTPGWKGMSARAVLGNAGARILPIAAAALGQLGARMRQL